MIRLIFTIHNEVFRIEVKDKEIWYADRTWKKGIRLIPKEEDIHRKILMSRNKFPNFLLTLFELNEEEKKEYENAATEQELSVICKRDALSKGCKLVETNG